MSESTLILKPEQVIPADIIGPLAAGLISFYAAHNKVGGSKRNFYRKLAKMVKAGLAPTSLLRSATVRSEYESMGSVIASGSDLPSSASATTDRVVAAENRARQAEKALADALSLSSLLAGVSSIPVRPEPLWLSEEGTSGDESVPILVLTDWHLGERVDPKQAGGYAYDLNIARRRIAETVERSIRMLRRHLSGLTYPGIIVSLAGDMVSGALHAELAETDEQGILRSVITARDLIVEVLKRLADEFGAVFVPTAVGNHGRMFDRRPRAKGYSERNADWLIYELVADAFRDDPRVHIVNPSAGETVFSVFGTTFLLTHGDKLGTKGGDGIIGPIGPIMRGNMKTRASLESLGIRVQHVIMGHWHQSIFLPSATVCGAMVGPNEYSLGMLRAPAEDPSQTLMVVHREYGITFRQPVFLKDDACPDRDARRETGAGWVNVFSDAA